MESPTRNQLRKNENTQTENQIPGPGLLRRGLTVAVISRPSRKDNHLSRQAQQISKTSTPKSNNNTEQQPSTSSAANEHSRANPMLSRTRTDLIEQRRRSSSTSDAQAHRNNNKSVNNNELPRSAMRMQQPPQPFRIDLDSSGLGADNRLPISTNSPAKRMTLREQQVIQLRREIAHVGGVRFQLRRKDCLGSIAWVDCFGAVW